MAHVFLLHSPAVGLLCIHSTNEAQQSRIGSRVFEVVWSGIIHTAFSFHSSLNEPHQKLHYTSFENEMWKVSWLKLGRPSSLIGTCTDNKKCLCFSLFYFWAVNLSAFVSLTFLWSVQRRITSRNSAAVVKKREKRKTYLQAVTHTSYKCT